MVIIALTSVTLHLESLENKTSFLARSASKPFLTASPREAAYGLIFPSASLLRVQLMFSEPRVKRSVRNE